MTAAEAALTTFEGGFWGRKFPVVAQIWRRAWQEVIPFFAFPKDVRRIIYTTNAIEALIPSCVAPSGQEVIFRAMRRRQNCSTWS